MRALAAIVALLACLVCTGPVLAHASLLSAAPSDGAVVAVAPKTLDLRFNEPVSPTALTLVAPDGGAVQLHFTVDDTSVSVPAPSGLGDGTYALSWRVISADGHPVGGTTIFSIGRPSSGGAPPAGAAGELPVDAAIWLTRLFTYAGLFFGVGGVFFQRVIAHSRRGDLPIRIALAAGLVALPLDIGLQGLDALDRPLTALVAPEVWQEGVASSFGLFAALAAVSLVAALLASRGMRFSPLLAALALLLVGGALASTGHASAADPQWLTRPMVFLHTTAIAFWVGALLPLAALLRTPDQATAPALRRFSNTIPALLLLLVGAGMVLAVVQLGSAGELLTTDYGRVFLGKLAAVLTLLGLGAYNRWALTGEALDEPTARRRLIRLIAVETLVALLIFGIVALWRFTPPPRALLEAAAVPASVAIHTGDGMAELTVTPGHAGAVSTTILVATGDMGPLDADGVTVDFSNPGKGIEPIERQATLGADGLWHIDGLTLPVGGDWHVGIAVLVSTFKEIDLADEIAIRP